MIYKAINIQLYEPKHTTVETKCVKRYFNNKNYEVYSYSENIIGMQLKLHNNAYVLKTVSKVEE